MSKSDTERFSVDQAAYPPGRIRRFLYHGRRQQQRLLIRHRTVIALTSVAAAALAVILVVAVWPAPQRRNAVQPGLPRSPATPAPTAPAASPTPSPSADPPTAGVPGQPPLPGAARPSTQPPAARPPRATQPAHDITPVGIEAESSFNELAGAARIRTSPNASNEHTITGLGVASGEFGALRITGLNVAVPGTYTLTVFYVAEDGNRPARIRVNGEVPITVTFTSTGNRDTIGSRRLRLVLNQRGNTVTFDNRTGRAPDIDRVVLSN
ncbi:MAG: hypothetical protein QOE03_2494 [Micromonosporaceae bacterium]|nr:hypothetical protein [Micromonosporaceae bacterium]